MQRFYHHDIENINAIIAEANVAMAAYNKHSLNSETLYKNLLDHTTLMYKKLGLSDRENKALTIQTDFTLACSGVNPLTYQKQTTHKREMLKTIMAKGFSDLQILLEEDHKKAFQKLEEGNLLLTQITTAALQAGLITDSMLDVVDQSSAETIWKKLSTDSNINLGIKRMALILHPADSLLLFIDQLQALKNSILT